MATLVASHLGTFTHSSHACLNTARQQSKRRPPQACKSLSSSGSRAPSADVIAKSRQFISGKKQSRLGLHLPFRKTNVGLTRKQKSDRSRGKLSIASFYTWSRFLPSFPASIALRPTDAKKNRLEIITFQNHLMGRPYRSNHARRCGIHPEKRTTL